jgi:hypothetical protein
VELVMAEEGSSDEDESDNWLMNMMTGEDVNW